MKVKTLIPHANGYGATFSKAVGDAYEIPDLNAGPLIAAGLVAEVNARPRRPAPRRSKMPAAAPAETMRDQPPAGKAHEG